MIAFKTSTYDKTYNQVRYLKKKYYNVAYIFMCLFIASNLETLPPNYW